MLAIQPSIKQARFLAATADIAVYGGAAGGGKTYGLALEPLYHIGVPGFNAVFFRRTMPQIKNAGGLWDESYKLYKPLGAIPNKNDFTWTFGAQGAAYVKFDSLIYDSTVYDFQGAQIPLLCFDELTHFTSAQFWYMYSRNRSTCGVKPYVRASTNPDASSWVKNMLAPWVDSKWAGKPAVSGELRYFIRANDAIEWVPANYVGPEGETPISITFISASVYDNTVLLQTDPDYIRKLLALNYVEKRRLLFGDWDVMPEAGKVFNRLKFGRALPPGDGMTVRFWDFAATEKQLKKPVPDYTVGVKMVKYGNRFYVVDVIAIQAAPADVDAVVMSTAALDGPLVAIRWEIEGGSGGKMVSHYLATQLQAYDARGIRPRGDKVQRSRAFASQVEAGNVFVSPYMPGDESYLNELHHFPQWRFDDRVDASSGAYNYLVLEAGEWNNGDLESLRS